MKFTRMPEGLYQFKVPQTYKEELKVNQEEKSNNMIQTVDENKIVYTKRQMERAKIARKLYHIGSFQSNAQEQHYQKLSCYCS